MNEHTEAEIKKEFKTGLVFKEKRGIICGILGMILFGSGTIYNYATLGIHAHTIKNFIIFLFMLGATITLYSLHIVDSRQEEDTP